MHRKASHKAILGLALMGLAVIGSVRHVGAAPNGKSSCETCHSKIAAAYAEGAHASAHMTCVDCHGGNAADMAVTAMSHGAGFKPKPTRAQIPTFCAGCHSNAGLMKQYGLPSHQLEDYKTSRHGLAWARGDRRVAVCTDCHGGHGLRKVSDPQSSVYRPNVAKTCAKCHADAKLMGRYGLPSDVYDEYEKSSHAKMLKGGGRLAAPSCPQCHGSHSALPPMVGQIQNVCGQCHRPIAEFLLDNPHAPAARAGHFGQCISCHGNHAILPPQLSMLNTTCRKCHAQDSEPAALGAKLETMVLQAQARQAEAEKGIERLARLGADAEKMRGRLDEASTALKQIATIQHTLSVEKTQQQIIAVESICDEITGDIASYLRTLAVRRWALVPIWAYLLFTLGLLYWKRRRVEERDADPSAAAVDQGGG